jgi:hypothetical protein
MVLLLSGLRREVLLEKSSLIYLGHEHVNEVIA